MHDLLPVRQAWARFQGKSFPIVPIVVGSFEGGAPERRPHGHVFECQLDYDPRTGFRASDWELCTQKFSRVTPCLGAATNVRDALGLKQVASHPCILYQS